MEVTDHNRSSYHQLFSAIFSDGHVFANLHGSEEELDSAVIAKHLERLYLTDKVKLVGSSFSSTDLSQGERKRLALCNAWLEDRPFYLFDEWAAGQDPPFKTIFYRDILPELKSRGKTIFVISHDDGYFDVADRVLRLEHGKLVEVPSDHANTPPSE